MDASSSLPEVYEYAYTKVRNTLLHQFNHVSKIRLVAFLREQNWWRLKVKFQQKIYAEETETDMAGDFAYKWLSKSYQVAFRGGRPKIIGWDETTVTENWTDAWEDY